MADVVSLEINTTFTGAEEYARAGGLLKDLSGDADGAITAITSLGIAQSALSVGAFAANERVNKLGLGMLDLAAIGDSLAVETAKLNAKIQSMKLEGITEGLKSIQEQFGGTITEQARAMFGILSQGAIDSSSALSRLAEANRLALATMQDIPAAANGITAAMFANKLESLSATKAADLLTIAFNAIKDGAGDLAKDGSNAAVKLSDLSEALKNNAGDAESAGVSLKELLAATVALTKEGVTSSDAMGKVAGIIQAIAAPTDEARAAAAKYGIQLDITTLRAKDLGGFLDYLKEKTGNQTAELKKIVGGTKAYADIMALTGDQAETFRSVLARLGDAENATEIAIRKNAATRKQSMDALSTSFKAIQEEIGTVLAPLANAIAEITNVSYNIIKAHHDVALAIGGVLVAVSAVSATVGVGSLVFGGFSKAVAATGITMGSAGSATTGLASVTRSIIPLAVLATAAIGGVAYAAYALSTNTTASTAATKRHAAATTDSTSAMSSLGSIYSYAQSAVQRFTTIYSNLTAEWAKASPHITSAKEAIGVLVEAYESLALSIDSARHEIAGGALAFENMREGMAAPKTAVLGMLSAFDHFGTAITAAAGLVGYTILGLSDVFTSHVDVVNVAIGANNELIYSYTPFEIAGVRAIEVVDELDKGITYAAISIAGWARVILESYGVVNASVDQQTTSSGKLATATHDLSMLNLDHASSLKMNCCRQ